MEHETAKLKELEEGYGKELKDWKSDLKPRKQVRLGWLRFFPTIGTVASSVLYPDQIERQDSYPHQSDKQDTDSYQSYKAGSAISWIRIQIKVKSWIRIRIKVTSRIRIRIKEMRIHNTGSKSCLFLFYLG